MATPRRGTPVQRRGASSAGRSASAAQLALFFLSTATAVSAQADCISLEGSSLCPAFQSASVATTGPTANFFPFMRFVNSRQTFDTQLATYIATDYVSSK